MAITRFQKEMQEMTVETWIEILQGLDTGNEELTDKYVSPFCTKDCKYFKSDECDLNDCEKRELEYWNEPVNK